MRERRRPFSGARSIIWLLLAGTLFGVTACGGKAPAQSSTNNASASSPLSKAVAYSACMRAHGVPKFPDPTSNGEIPKTAPQQLGVSSSQFQAAAGACAHLLPATQIGGPTQTEVQQAMSGMVRFAGCMRAHGVPHWPDPTLDIHGRPTFMLPTIDPKSRLVTTAVHDCQHLMPHSVAPRICSKVLAQQIGGPPGAYACYGGSARVP